MTFSSNKINLISSYLFMVVAILSTLIFHFMTVAMAGLLIFTLTRCLENKLLLYWNFSHKVRAISLFLVLSLAFLFVFLIFMGIHHLILTIQLSNSSENKLLTQILALLIHLKSQVPDFLKIYIPNDLDKLQNQIMFFFSENTKEVSSFGYNSLKTSALILIGLVLGAILAVQHPKNIEAYQPLSAAIFIQIQHFIQAFQKTVFAQIKIAFISTLFTGLYLAVFLPSIGTHLQYVKTLILITFITALLPVFGNLISNTVIVLISATHSLHIAGFSLLFLVSIHKLEYFINAKIMGTRIDAKIWEMILAMLFMEACFGFRGLIAAPIIYAYLKKELTLAGLIGLKLTSQAEKQGTT
ncbi:MAG: AI-2E family transporter [Neisseriaceae bacterium]|nr:AI-2E family transporter [Neisseriaceae bacterium]